MFTCYHGVAGYSGTRPGPDGYRSVVAEASLRDPELARRLLVHEARAQQSVGRELRDLGDGWLLHDPADPEPFWNRLIAPRWPDPPAAFERRLDEVVTLFATLDRLPHIRPMPVGNEPSDLTSRLLAAGFEIVGGDRRMLLVDPSICRDAADRWRREPRAGLTVERLPEGAPGRRRPWATEVAMVLAEAFRVDPLRRVALETDVLACAARRGCSLILLREDGVPVAVARRASVGDGSYLSSIGTRPAWRGRGLGTLATALAVADALEAGSSFVHLAIELDNERTRVFYERLGFAVIGDAVPDLLLR
jgi:ribosomal protein S18 acetylase RimI-like enzyme